MNQGAQKGKKSAKKDPIICFCYSVPESEIIRAIQNGAQSVMDVRRDTFANTGCGGCKEDVIRLLKKYSGTKPSAPENVENSKPNAEKKSRGSNG